MNADTDAPVAGVHERARPRRGPRSRLWLHVVLLAATAATLAGCWAFVFQGYPPWRVDLGGAYAFSVLAVLGAHEAGHYLACRHHGVRASLPYFLPGFPLGTFGALIRIRQVVPDRRALFDIAAAGPIAGFVVALPILLHGVWSATPLAPLDPDVDAFAAWHFGHSALSWGLVRLVHGGPGVLVGPTYVGAWFGLLVTSMNLFPVGQLDGGHVAYAVSARLHRFLAWGTTLALLTWVATYSIVRWEPSPYLLWCVVLLVLGTRHPPIRSTDAPLGRGRRAVAWALAGLFVATLMPVPIRLG